MLFFPMVPFFQGRLQRNHNTDTCHPRGPQADRVCACPPVPSTHVCGEPGRERVLNVQSQKP